MSRTGQFIIHNDGTVGDDDLGVPSQGCAAHSPQKVVDRQSTLKRRARKPFADKAVPFAETRNNKAGEIFAPTV